MDFEASVPWLDQRRHEINYHNRMALRVAPSWLLAVPTEERRDSTRHADERNDLRGLTLKKGVR
jgi:hypothetical protein